MCKPNASSGVLKLIKNPKNLKNGLKRKKRDIPFLIGATHMIICSLTHAHVVPQVAPAKANDDINNTKKSDLISVRQIYLPSMLASYRP